MFIIIEILFWNDMQCYISMLRHWLDMERMTDRKRKVEVGREGVRMRIKCLISRCKATLQWNQLKIPFFDSLWLCCIKMTIISACFGDVTAPDVTRALNRYEYQPNCNRFICIIYYIYRLIQRQYVITLILIIIYGL